MTNRENTEVSLESQLESLRSIDASESAQRVLKGIRRRAHLQRRQVLAAAFCSCVAAIAAIYFLLLAELAAGTALLVFAIAMVIAAKQSARLAVSLGTLKSGATFLASWRSELEGQLRHTALAPVLAALFVALTAWVVWRHGMQNWKSAMYLAMATGVCTFAVYQYIVIRPSLQSELVALDNNG